jgi:ribosome-associated translation inhibitor RaiA
MIENHLNIIVAMNEWLTHAFLESNVRKRQKGEISLEYEVGKLQNMNKEYYKRMIKAIKYVNAKLNTKIRKRKWWSDFLF